MRQGASVEWHPSFPLMNSFNITEAAIFPIQALLPEGFPFHQFNFTYVYVSVSFIQILMLLSYFYFYVSI